MRKVFLLGLFFFFTACATTPHKSSGIIYMQQGLYNKAVTEFQAWVAENPNNPEAHIWLGRAYIGTRDYIKAAEEFIKAYELDADSGKYLKEFGENEINTILTAGKTLFQQGDDSKALKYFTYVTKINPKDERAYLAIAVIYNKQGNLEEAINFANKAIELNPKDLQALYYRAKFYAQAGKKEEAKRDLLEVVEKDTTFTKAYFDLGVLYFDDQEFENAAKYFKKAYELDKENLDALLNMALSYYRLSNYGEAEKLFREYLEKQPDAYDIWFTLGACLYNENKMQEALNAFDKAIELKPDYEDAYSFKALIYNQLKMNKELMETIKKLQEIKGNNGGNKR
uniref:Tetratricopeptide repeat protein n=1 Tax=candidate division WOR-3 bacterium TaxID=2052148 RepID=A0A7V3ZYM3_UNCW3